MRGTTGSDDKNDKGETKESAVQKDGTASDAAWLFGSDSDKHAAAGALQFSEAKLARFPHPLRQGQLRLDHLPADATPCGAGWCFGQSQKNAKVWNRTHCYLPWARCKNRTMRKPYSSAAGSKLALGDKVVLEEYTFSPCDGSGLSVLGNHGWQASCRPTSVWKEITSRLVILSDGMMSFFAQNACEVAQHVKHQRRDRHGRGRRAFQPGECPQRDAILLCGSLLPRAWREVQRTRRPPKPKLQFTGKLADKVFQFGGDASTGLGYCTVKLGEKGA